MKTLTSKIRLCKGINVDREYINVLNYTEQQMLSLCESQEHLVASANNYSFIRNRGTISTSFDYDDALKSNYIAFQNKDYSNKWFFAWIDEVNYIGEKNTEIKYTIDSWSTWFSQLSVKPCFVVREHVDNDTIGLHTIPEDLNIGDVQEESAELLYNPADPEDPDNQYKRYYYIIMSTYNPLDTRDFDGVQAINGNLFGSYIFIFQTYSVSVSYMRTFLRKTNADGKIGSVLSIFTAPRSLIDAIGKTHYSGTYDGATYEFDLLTPSYVGQTSQTAIETSYTSSKVHSFTNFTPKNNKCYVYPYNYALISNNIGSQNILKYEDFGDANNMVFAVQSSFSIGISARIIPRQYKGVNYNFDESLALAKYPTGAWSSDAYTNWLTQNSVNIASSIGIGIGSLALGIATGGIALGAGLISIAGATASLIGQFNKADMLPNISGGQATGDVNFSSNSNNFYLHKMRVKTEYLQVIDDYFTRYGYKINRLKVPNITGRTYWNYVEIGSSEDIGTGDVPSKFMEQINNACRKGVTIWHNHNNIGNFNLNNTIVQ